jgi:hypothetical protein
MLELQALARETILLRAWPGPESVVINYVISILHAIVLLDAAIAIALHPSTTSARCEFELGCESRMPISLSMLNPEAGEILRKAYFA